ncbi:MAG: bifunctional riboflavin kinase/FAD synthetase [Candidatus Omnitrophica bacterium]|nr:bifunctional riboflavin kinase/FAD synthetase [Candidatus Omnitrophota bacterium]
MRVFYGKFPSKRIECVATIGVFDGLHLGHRYIIDKVKDYAKKEKIPSLVITFDVPPRLILNKQFSGCISTLEDKIETFRSLGVSYLWVLKTRNSLLRLSGEDFLNFVFRHLAVKKIIVGSDFRFGRRGRYNAETLNKFGKKFGFKVSSIKKRKLDKEIISSSLLRELIKKGNIKDTNKFLGRNYSFKGEVIKGVGKGKKLGFPTANISTINRAVVPKGVYAASVKVGTKTYLAAVNIGTKPTITRSKKVIIETHIINFSKDIIGKEIEISLLKRIRDEKKFSSLEKLKQAIAADVSHVIDQRQ